MKKNEITALVLTSWDHPRCKFYPGDTVVACVSAYHNVPKTLSDRKGQTGKVFAVSSPDGINIRGSRYSRGYNERMFTRYYVEFSDGECYGFHSHYLKKA